MTYLATVINAPFLYVHGNHDAQILKNPPEGCICIDGKMIIYKGIRILGIGGSMKYNSDVLQFTEKEMTTRVLKLLPKVLLYKGFDILVTHAGAYKIGDLEDQCHKGFSVFNKLLNKFKPKYFFHGHSHLNYDLKNNRIIELDNTKVVNAYEYYVVNY